MKTLDFIIAITAFFAAFWLRTLPIFEGGQDFGTLSGSLWLLVASLLIHIVIYPIMGFYQSLRLKTSTEVISMCLKAFIFEFFILGSLVFLIQAKTTSRYFFGLFLLLNYAGVIAEKLGGRSLLSAIRQRGFNYRQVVIAGTGSNARQVVQAIRRHKHWGYVPIGYLKIREEETGTATSETLDLPVLGSVGDLEEIIKSQAVDEVYFAPDVFQPAVFDRPILVCERLGITVRISLGHFDLSHSKVTFSMLDHLPVFTFYTALMTPTQAIIKRTIDISVSLVGLLICTLVYPWIARRIRKESPGPVIFKQIRVGENGRRFKCYKFRTMYLDAEARKQELLKQNQMTGPIFKIENDPRIFPFGAFLRRSSLDELPQFLNILRGDMSVVGTRPPTPDEVSHYKTHFRRRLSIRPGLTGLWQVSGRNRVSDFEDILALDLKYIDNWSVWLDIKIILKTIWVAFSRSGAH